MKKVVETRKDIAFYMVMFPLTSIHPEAYDKSKAIVCAESNEKGMQLLEDVYAKKEIPKPTCETDVIDKNIQLAVKLGIRGTPAIIFEDGRMKSGAIQASQLIQLVDKK
jgi:thiol:disulfide interchange protein DsbC